MVFNTGNRRPRKTLARRILSLLRRGGRIAAALDIDPVPDNEPAANATELQILFDRTVSEMTLGDGTPVRLRPILPDDKDHLRAGMSRLSEQTRYRRFMSSIDELSPDLLRYLTEIDYEDHFALAALALDQEPPLGIGIARYVRDPNKPHVAEPAVTIIDDYQGRGLGKLLLEHIMRDAVANGITHFRAMLLADNVPMKELFAQQDATFSNDGCGVLIAEFALPSDSATQMDLVQKLARHAYKGAISRSQRQADTQRSD